LPETWPTRHWRGWNAHYGLLFLCVPFLWDHSVCDPLRALRIPCCGWWWHDSHPNLHSRSCLGWRGRHWQCFRTCQVTRNLVGSPSFWVNSYG
jgi:hypothetical protein